MTSFPVTADVTPFPVTAEFEEGRLTALGSVDVNALVAGFGTPLWVIDETDMWLRMMAVTSAMAHPRDAIYAAKALCVTGILQMVLAGGMSVDIATSGELATALRAGFDGDRIIVHGNNKSDAELRMAIDARVGRIVVDSFDELDRLEAMTADAAAPVNVLLRVTPGVITTTHAAVQTGQDDSKFGFTLSSGTATAAVKRVMDAPGLVLRGLHSHIGSQIANMDEFTSAARRMVALIANLGREHGIVLDELDLGGGPAIMYSPDDVALEPGAWARAVRGAVEDATVEHDLHDLRVMIEPGRIITGPAGVTLYRVGTVKRLDGVRTYVSVDGGMSDNLRPALYDARYTFAFAGDRAVDAVPESGAPETVTVVGKHCESGDRLGDDIVLDSRPQVGDVLAVAATGAYNHSLFSNYNRLPRPAMVVVGNGSVRPILKRQSIDDVLAEDVPLPIGDLWGPAGT